jgi:diaminopimelate decarboxylase
MTPLPAARPPAFAYRKQSRLLARAKAWELCCDEIPVARLAERYGTPLYVYSAKAIRERVRMFERAFEKTDCTICYSVKANSNLGLLRLLAGLDCGFDVVSGGELERVRTAAPKKVRRVVFSGVGKTREELLSALRAGILLFNIESEAELWALTECAAQLRRKPRIAVRVNPDVAAKTHPYISTGLHQHKFGVPMKDARTLYAKAASSGKLEVAGVSVHIGSQITDVAPFGETMERVAQLVRDLRQDGHDIRYVDAGGGLGIDYASEGGEVTFAETVREYAKALLGPLRGLKVHLLLEPGRSIVAQAGALVTSVVYRKSNNGKRFLIVDAAMNDLIRPALYGAQHAIVPVRVPVDRAPETETVDVVGPVCETGDFLARERELPEMREGGLLAVLDAGAYGMALASNYNTRPRAAEIIVDGKSARVIRRRETIRDLLAQER